jgi:hypothetical protein
MGLSRTYVARRSAVIEDLRRAVSHAGHRPVDRALDEVAHYRLTREVEQTLERQIREYLMEKYSACRG